MISTVNQSGHSCHNFYRKGAEAIGRITLNDNVALPVGGKSTLHLRTVGHGVGIGHPQIGRNFGQRRNQVKRNRLLHMVLA